MKISEMIGAIIPTLVFNAKAFGCIGALNKRKGQTTRLSLNPFLVHT